MDKNKFYTKKINIILLAVISCILWGSAYPAIKIGYSLFNISSADAGSKLVFAGYRFVLAGILVLVFQIIRQEKVLDFTKHDYISISILGLIQTTMQYIFFYIGLTYTTGVRGSIINGTGTFFSILLAHFLYKNDRLNLNKIIGCIVGFAGVIIVSINGSSSLNGSFSFMGEGFIMIAALCFAVGAVYSKKITQNKNASTITGFQLLIGGVVLTVLGFVMGGRLTNFTAVSSLLLLYMALLSSVAFTLWTQLLKFNKVGDISIFNFLVPVFGTLLSAVFLGENIFNIKILISLGLVCIGIYAVNKEHKLQ